MTIEEPNSVPSPNDDQIASVGEYLQRAADAAAAGKQSIALHLYIAAFERGVRDDGGAPAEDSILAIKHAWHIACSMKERSLAEYVFERMEPYLTNSEVTACAEQLQILALDKLEEFGLSREELEDMTDMIAQDLAGSPDAHLLRVEHLTEPGPNTKSIPRRIDPDPEDDIENFGMSFDDEDGFKSIDEADFRKLAGVAAGGGNDSAKPVAPDDARIPDMPLFGMLPGARQCSDQAPAASDPQNASPMGNEDHLTYSELVGYDAAIDSMRAIGIGMGDDPQFRAFVAQLNSRHGLDRMPACDTLLITSPAREDANHFMMATIGELGLPVIRMRMEENMQGLPVLCVMAQADNQPKLNSARNSFEGPGILVIEDVDMWGAPEMQPNSVDDFGGLIMASLSRGAREAVNLIRNAADNPDVFVFATGASGCDVDPFFMDLFGPTSLVDIDYPTDSERADIWLQIAREHPSARGIDREALVRYSAGLPRFDIYMAAREAVEEAYKESLRRRTYVPITSDNLFDKLAAYQPLDSPEYKALEQAVINDFKSELDHIDDLLKGAQE